MGRYQVPSTVGTDITVGLNQALQAAKKEIGVEKGEKKRPPRVQQCRRGPQDDYGGTCPLSLVRGRRQGCPRRRCEGGKKLLL